MSKLHYTDAEKIKRLSAWHESEKAEIIQLNAENARLTAGNEAMQEDARNNTATISAMKELLIKAESALTYANWDGEFSKQATAQDVINARDAIRAILGAL